MKLVHVFLFLSILVMPLLAQKSSFGLLITKTSKESNLKKIKHRLDKLNIKMYVKKTNNFYYVYSGSYTNENAAKASLKKLKTYFPSTRMLSLKNTKAIEEKTDEIQKVLVVQEMKIEEEIGTEEEIAPVFVEKPTSINELNEFFINVALGASSISASTNNAAALSASNSGLSYTLEAGYYFDENLYSSFAYLDSSTSDIALTNFYASLNYSFNVYDSTDVYIGGLLGYSSLELEDFSSSSASTSALFGWQIGLSYELDDELSDDFYLYSGYQGMLIDHKVVLDATSSIKFSFLHNLQLGLGYRF